MEVERWVVVLFTLLGLVGGVMSNYLHGLVGLASAVVLPWAVCSLLVALSHKLLTPTRWLALNSLVTFGLVWLVTWIFLYNLHRPVS
jgi:hypothetical protein